MKEDKTKKMAIVVGIIVALLAIIGLIAMTLPQSAQSMYGEEAIRVLESYKNFTIDAKEAAKRIDDLADKIDKDMASEPKDSKKYHRLWSLWLDLNSVYFELNYKSGVAGYEIDKAINKIKKDM